MDFYKRQAYEIACGIIIMMVAAKNDRDCEISARHDEVIAGTTDIDAETSKKLRELGWDEHPDIPSWRYTL